MKMRLVVAMATLVAFISCQKNEERLTSASDIGVLYATIEDANTTRTTMDENNNILWSEGDQIVAFMKSSYGHKYQVKPSFVGKSYADFSMVSSGNGSDLSAGNEWEHNVVYYPYSDVIECLKTGEHYVLGVALPSEQSYVPESFGNGAMAMVAVSGDNNITFRNVLGGMKLQLRGTQKVVSITLQGKNSEKLSGAATVTAYIDETKPALTMASGASTSVTLNCGSGVQLNESTATEFILALPPVLFSKGFTVTVTDSDSKTYTVETDKANTVLRSSLLTMPAFKLGETPGQDDSDGGLVETVFIDRTSLTIAPNTSYTFETDVDPFDVSDKTLTWSSSASSVVEVNQDGTVTALSDGTAVITAVAVGGASASCTVKVVSCVTPSSDYIDEYGFNHGKGIAIGDVVWAPVNCGYKAATSDSKGFPYGKMYQWGRKYGQGNSSNDESYPSGDNRVEGPVMPSVAQSEENAEKFYYNDVSPCDWSKVQNDEFWNSGTESAPVKTKYDPCPTGWRVPTYAELDGLSNNYSSWTTVDGQNGRYLAGDYTYLADAPQVFFPAAGYLYYGGGNAFARGGYGDYWSSRPSSNSAYRLNFNSSSTNMSYDYRAYGYSVRCVQE